MSEQENKQQRIYDLLNAETKPTFLSLLYTKQSKAIFFHKNSFWRKRGMEDLTKNEKKVF